LATPKLLQRPRNVSSTLRWQRTDRSDGVERYLVNLNQAHVALRPDDPYNPNMNGCWSASETL